MDMNRKYIIIFNITDLELLYSWHNGYCAFTKVKYGFNTYEDAEEYANNIILKKYSELSDEGDNRYNVKTLILSYKDNETDNIKEFFKYKEID